MRVLLYHCVAARSAAFVCTELPVLIFTMLLYSWHADTICISSNVYNTVMSPDVHVTVTHVPQALFGPGITACK